MRIHSDEKRLLLLKTARNLVLFFQIFLILASIIPIPERKPYSLLLEDRNGRFLHAFLADDGMWRFKTSPDEIPEKLKQILIRREDQFFYYHPGVNPLAVVRAMIQNISSGETVSGASTITMQVARMLDRRERTYFNKAIEMFRALQLEMRYSKDEILEMYLSMVPLGGNIEGLKSASLLYYQTPVERLNIAQLFDLTLIPSSPNRLRPDRNGERLFTARTKQATQWLKEGYFSWEDSVVLWQTPAVAERKELPRHAPHFALRLRNQSGSRKEVRSTLDLDLQETVESLLAKHVASLSGTYNGAVLVLENRTGRVTAYCGSSNFHDAGNSGQFDAVRGIRSPGSALKPFLYALSMEKGSLTPKTMLLDVPYDIEGFTPENYTGRYSGPVTADAALQRSLNVPMIRMLQQTGVAEFLDFLQQARFATLESQRDELGLSTITGGCGTTLEELTTGYSIFANAGRWISPQFILEPEVERNPREVFSGSTAWMMTEILAGLDRPDYPLHFASAKTHSRIAYKTGTSFGRRDAWCIGYSSEYTVGVWIGANSSRNHANLVAAESATPLLFEILNVLPHSGTGPILEKPEDIQSRRVCVLSGQVPGAFCTATVEDYYSVTRSSDEVCQIEKEYLVANNSNVSYCPSCVSTHSHRPVPLADYPAELVAWWKSRGVSVTKPPPHNPECERAFGGNGPMIASPSSLETYFLTSKHQKIPLQARVPVDVNRLAWYLDGEFLGQKAPDETVFMEMNDGKHSVACVDDKGRRSTVRFRVVKAF